MITKRTMKMGLLVLGLALLLLASACAREPTAEIEAADTAFKNAQKAEAGVYAPEAMQAARDAHAELETELAAQKESFAMRRSYDRARELAAETESASREAVAAASAGKVQAREDAVNMLAELRTSLDEVKTMVDNAPRGKGSAADIAMLKGDLGGIDMALTDIEHAISAERFMDAVHQAQAAMESTAEIRADVERAGEIQRVARSTPRG